MTIMHVSILSGSSQYVSQLRAGMKLSLPINANSTGQTQRQFADIDIAQSMLQISVLPGKNARALVVLYDCNYCG